MTYRSRPAPRRRHRARWQDELRTQRLLVGGFAAAIAVALGLFGMTAWNSYYDSHLRQMLVVEGTVVPREALDLRQTIIGAELQATGEDINSQLGGARDPILQQQLSAVADQFNNLTFAATSSLEDGLFQSTRAPEFGISVAEAEIDAEMADRQSLPARIQMSQITVNALPEDAAAGAEPTEEDFARAEAEADDIRAQLDDGGDFAAIATAQSDDPGSARAEGLIGWVTADDAQYRPLFVLAEGAEVGDLVGPSRTETGFVILRVEARTEAGPFTRLIELLNSARVTEADYRAYIADELQRRAFRTYFEEQVVVPYAPQREIAQILVLSDQGLPVPKLRIRHLLAQPLPGAEDQAVATEQEWQAALVRAEAWYEEVQDPDADWVALAAGSDDPGSRNNGGDLGWWDPTSSQFVPEFEAAVADLTVGEISEPVRTDFGYHVIQVTNQRTTAMGFAQDLIDAVEADPDSFGAVALANSEDSGSRNEEGYAGWVARYEATPIREAAIFGLAETGDISTTPVVDGNQIWIFKLLGTAERRGIEQSRLNTIRSTGYSRWYQGLQADAQIWIDPQLQLDTGGAPTA
ncbi:MAG: peptidylprolyl isomerase [Candidatus Limnocylindria bacterium]